ncbi:PREDICTED: zona pellucida sperm-binding protein 3-like [Nanorana parkeri]|uniref:zona pellucida sperm-binding protein 3-like n=1 Tax=Nanorana parkeri TaxID=125878 RepID=UPI0008541B69|nr:PREDICTED: zona pellucida sperm-binding protein 3-like [Nanorana parkeri]
MGLWVRSSWLLLALVFWPGFGLAGDGALVRQGRQSEWWRSHQGPVPSRGSARRGFTELYWGGNEPVVGFGALRGESQLGGRDGMLRQLLQSRSSPISVQCGEDIMVVSVKRDLYGNGKLVRPSDLSQGPQRCKPDPQSTDRVVIFQNGLQDCGNTVQTFQDWLIYTTNLTYSPTSSITIIRTNPAVVPILCYYYRHGNVSSKAVKPTWIPFSTTVTSEERLSFSLQLMTEDWSGPRSSPIFQLGDVLYIEASVDTRNHMNLVLYIDQCVATVSPDANSAPNYNIFIFCRCLMDGMQDDSSSAFITPRAQPDKLRFTVDAFRFLGVEVSLIYITCYLKAAAATQVPDSMTKACSYSKATTSWSAVEGPTSICQCCEMSTCSNPSGPIAGGRSRFGRPRAFGKREAVTELNIEEGQKVTTLGPLIVIGPKQSDVAAAVTKEESPPLQLWVLVAIGCLSLLVVLVCVMFIRKSLTKSRVLSVEQ